VYAIVLVTTVLLIGLRCVRFFEMEGLGKFYREISLKVMNVTTAATVILPSARQLPRELSDRTIYPPDHEAHGGRKHAGDQVRGEEDASRTHGPKRSMSP
jgi:hypothetical protein